MVCAFNEKIAQVTKREEELQVIFHAWKGVESSRGFRVCTFESSGGVWRFKNETWMPTPSEDQARTGHATMDQVRHKPRKKSSKCITIAKGDIS